MTVRPVALDHVNVYVRNVERSLQWYTDVLGLHTQDTFTSPETGRLSTTSHGRWRTSTT
jgi:catechol 2,3-dioxygenase-like lactoylglutathione lyase family enzyme